ncbi:hypothetical protein OROHE_018294 [Orobanche hederae]
MESLRLPHQTIKQNTQTELSEIIPIKTGVQPLWTRLLS